jgi:arylsulfatase
MGHLPSDVAPDLRSRSYTITAHVEVPEDERGNGVLLSHGDATSGYTFFLRDGFLIHELNIGGDRYRVTSDRVVEGGAHELGFRMVRTPRPGAFPHGVGTLLIDGHPAGVLETDRIFWLMISWSGLDIGLDRGTTVTDYEGSGRYVGPFRFNGQITKVTVDLDTDQDLDHDAAGSVELARE